MSDPWATRLGREPCELANQCHISCYRARFLVRKVRGTTQGPETSHQRGGGPFAAAAALDPPADGSAFLWYILIVGLCDASDGLGAVGKSECCV